jgi:hypothetical protein
VVNYSVNHHINGITMTQALPTILDVFAKHEIPHIKSTYAIEDPSIGGEAAPRHVEGCAMLKAGTGKSPWHSEEIQRRAVLEGAARSDQLNCRAGHARILEEPGS